MIVRRLYWTTLLWIFIPSLVFGATLPTPPAQMDVTPPTLNGTSFTANSCGTIQAQINAAAAANVNLNHQVVINTGASLCAGEFTLPAHLGTGWITITGPNGAVVSDGTRIGPSNSASMPHLVQNGSCSNCSGNGNRAAVFSALDNAQRYRLLGLDIQKNPATANATNNWITLGIRNPSAGNNPAVNTGYFVIDRVLIQNQDPMDSGGRGIDITAEAGNVAVINSYCSGMKQAGKEVQCISTDRNKGPILIDNTYTEAAGENIIFCGGVDPENATIMPQDITIKRSTFTIPDAWHTPAINSIPTPGNHFVQKTLLEFKCGKRILVEGNDFVNQGGSEGSASWRITPRVIFGGATFIEVSDLEVRYNRWTHNTNMIHSSTASDDSHGCDWNDPLQQSTCPDSHTFQSATSHRWYFHDNLGYDFGVNCIAGSYCGELFTIQAGGAVHFTGFYGCIDNPNAIQPAPPAATCAITDLVFSHNTFDDLGANGSSGIMQLNFSGGSNYVNRDNIVNGKGGIIIMNADGVGNRPYGTHALDYSFPSSSWQWLNNSYVSGSPSGVSNSEMPQGNGNLYPSNLNGYFTNVATRDYSIPGTSPAFLSASDGTNRGVNFTAFNNARGSGDNTPPSIPANLRIVGTIGAKNVNLAWDASIDDTAVTGYQVEHCAGAGCSTFVLAGSPASASFNDAGILTATSYTFRVRAFDAAQNFSGYSSTLTQTTDTVKFNLMMNLRRVSTDDLTSLFTTYFGGHYDASNY